MSIKTLTMWEDDYNSFAICTKEQQKAEWTLMEKLLTAERNRLAGARTYSTDDVRREINSILFNE